MERITSSLVSASIKELPDTTSQERSLRDAAQNLEAVFLSEMLKAAKFGETPEFMGGGVGEDQFGSFLRDAQAKSIAETRSIGLAEAIFNAMKGAEDVE